MELIDNYMPEYQVSDKHEVKISANATVVYNAVVKLKPSEISRIMKILTSLRELPARFKIKTRRLMDKSEKPFLEQLYADGFIALEENPPNELVFGLVGKFWKLVPEHPKGVTSKKEFMEFEDPGYALCVANMLIRSSDNGVILSTETRVFVADRASEKKFRRYWMIIKPGSALLRFVWLRAIKKKAEKLSKKPV